jgi:hypothetical protein
LRKIAKPFWFALAALFLIEAWLWDRLGGLLYRLAALLPFEPLKQALARGLDRLPAPVVLLIFLIPVAIIEPFKLVALWLITHHHFLSGVAVFVALKFVGLALVAFLFDVTRDKLLSMTWFVRFYRFVLRMRALAHDFVEPYKRRIHDMLEPFKARWRAMIAALPRHGRLARKLALLRARVRRARNV